MVEKYNEKTGRTKKKGKERNKEGKKKTYKSNLYIIELRLFHRGDREL